MIGDRVLKRLIGEPDFSRGAAYFRQGKVVDVEVEGDDFVTGEVSGSGRRVYQQDIGLVWSRNGSLMEIEGSCTCPVGWNCKHVAAVMLAAGALLEPPGRKSRFAEDALPALPGAVDIWLQRLGESVTPVAPEPSPEKLFYVFHADAQHGAQVTPYKVRLLKTGELGTRPTEYRGGSNLTSPPKFMMLDDVGILQKLAALRGFGGRCDWPEGEALFGLLREIIATGRARGGALDGPELHWAAPRKGRFEWRMEEGGAQRLTLLDEQGAPMEALPFAPPLYIDRETGACGPVETVLAPKIAALSAAAPLIPPEAVSAVTERMVARRSPVPAPETVEIKKRKGTPMPVLRLLGWPLRIPAHLSYGFARPGEALEMTVPGVRPAFDYGGTIIAPDAQGDPTVREEGALTVIRRDRAAETAALGQLDDLYDYDAIPLREAKRMGRLKIEATQPDDWMFPAVDAPDNPAAADVALAFQAGMVPQLRAAGWRVEVDESWPLKLYDGPVTFEAGAESSGIDWFSFSLTLTAGEEVLDLLPIILSIIESLPVDAAGELAEDFDLDAFLDGLVLYPELSTGERVKLEAGPLAPIIRAFLEVHGLTGFHLAEAPRLRELAEALEGCGIPWQGDPAIFTLAEKLNALAAAPEADPPASLHAELRPYQKTGFGWLRALSETGFGGALADDMGLGKTVQALSLLAHRHLEEASDRPSIVIAPTSLVGVWQREAERFVPDLKVLVLHGPDRKARFGEIADHHLIVTTYPLLHRDHETLFAQDYDLAILDEAQAVKNPASSNAKRIREITARQRLALTGTPVENNLQEIWAIFDWLVPGLLGDRSRFNKQIRHPVEREGSTSAQKLLAARLRPFLLRRTKEEVALDLPPKTIIDERVPLEPKQAALYETLRVAMDARVRKAIREKGIDRSRITILDALLKLRQACCDPALVKLDAARKVTESAKRARLMALLEPLMAEGRKVLIFSQFVEMLKMIEADVKGQGWDYTMLTGRTRKRAEAIARFQEGDTPLFLISLKAGGTGLTLTEADTVILYDPWWNPAVERQAMDRAHRIGQTKPVFVHRLIAEDTVEAAIQQMQAKKQALADALFEEGAGGRLDMGENDIAALFAPVG